MPVANGVSKPSEVVLLFVFFFLQNNLLQRLFSFFAVHRFCFPLRSLWLSEEKAVFLLLWKNLRGTRKIKRDGQVLQTKAELGSRSEEGGF